MQQDREQCLPRIGEQRGAASFLLAIVDVQALHAVGVRDHADRRQRAFGIAYEPPSFGNVDDDQRRHPER
jgi:hypothetical protein